MSRGIIINGTGTVGRLSVFRVTLWPEGHMATKLDTSAEAALLKTLQAGEFDWIAGDAATRKLARKFHLVLRKRVPGAGRPTKPKAEKVVPFNVWMTPSGIQRVKAAAAAHKPRAWSYGAEIESRFPVNG